MATAYSKPLQYTPYQEQWNKELLAKALQYKQDKYDFNREKVKNTIGQTLRLDLIKDQDSEYLYDRLQSVVNTLNTQGLGDLSLDGRADYLSGYVAQVADQRVLNGYLGTQKVRRLQEEAEAAKKTGEYSDINYSYSMKDLSAWVNDGQVGSAVPVGANTSYVPFVDKFDVLQEVADKLKPDSVVRFEPFGGSGYTWYSQNGDILDQDELISAFNLKIASDPKLADQFRVDSWAQNQGVAEEDFLADTRENYQDYTEYYQDVYTTLRDAKNKTIVTEEKEYLQQQMDVAKESIKYYEDLAARSDEDILARREDIEYNNYRTDYLQVLANTLAYEQWDKPSLEVDRGAIALMQERGQNARHSASLAATRDGKILDAVLAGRNKLTETGEDEYLGTVMELYSDYIIESAARGGIGRNILLKPGKDGTQVGDYYDLSTEDGIQEYINQTKASATGAVQTSGQELETKGVITIEQLEQKQKATLKSQRAAFKDAMTNLYNDDYVNTKMGEFDNAVKDGTISNFLESTRKELDPMTVKNHEDAKPQSNTQSVVANSLNILNSVDQGMEQYIRTQPFIENANAGLNTGLERILNVLKEEGRRTFVIDPDGGANSRQFSFEDGRWVFESRIGGKDKEVYYTDEAAIQGMRDYFAENPENIADSFVDNYGEGSNAFLDVLYQIGNIVDPLQEVTFNSGGRQVSAGEMLMGIKEKSNNDFEKLGLNNQFAQSSYGIDLTSGEGRSIIAGLVTNNANGFLEVPEGDKERLSTSNFLALASNPVAMQTAQAAGGEGFSADSKDFNKVRLGGEGEISLEYNPEGGQDVVISLGRGRGGSYSGVEFEGRIPLVDFNFNGTDMGTRLVSELVASSSAYEQASERDQLFFNTMEVGTIEDFGYTAYSTDGINDLYFNGEDGLPTLQTQLSFDVYYNRPSRDNEYITVGGRATRWVTDSDGNLSQASIVIPGTDEVYKEKTFFVPISNERFESSDAANAYINSLLDDPVEFQTVFFNAIDGEGGFNQTYRQFKASENGETYTFPKLESE